MTRPLLVLLPGARPSADFAGADVLSFLRTTEEQAFREGRPPGDRWIPIGDLLRPCAEEMREAYVGFTSSWPRQLIGGRSFHERFREGRLGLWWLNSPSMKDDEGRKPIYRMLTQFAIFRDVCAQERTTRCVVLGGDRGLVSLLRQHCARAGIDFTARGGRRTRRRPLLLALAAHVRLAVRLVSWKVRAPRPTSSWPEASAVFFSLLPHSFGSAAGASSQDRHYRDLPEALAQRLPTAFLVHEGSWNPALRASATGLSESPPAPGVADLTSSYLSWSDPLYALACFRHSVRYWLLHTFNRTFRASFELLGLDARELVGPEYRNRFLSAEPATNLILMRAADRFGRRRRPRLVVCFLELYPTGRAVYEGIRRGSAGTALVAYQHAALSSGKLWYAYETADLRSDQPIGMPRPDWYLLMGELGRRIVMSSGFRQERALVVGSPRYDELARRVQEPGEGWRELRAGIVGPAGRVVLVAPSLDRADAEDLVASVAAALGDREGWTVVLRRHPLLPLDDAVAAAVASSRARVITVDAPLYDTVLASDLVIVSYSTVGEESFALARPVVCYAGRGPSMSALADYPEVPLVTDPAALADAVDEALVEPARALAAAPVVVAESFYRLDGKATERSAHALLAIAADAVARDASGGTA